MDTVFKQYASLFRLMIHTAIPFALISAGVALLFWSMAMQWHRKRTGAQSANRSAAWKDWAAKYWLFFNLALLLCVTIICRPYWPEPLQRLWVGWGVYDGGNGMDFDCVNNLLLFIPTIVSICYGAPSLFRGCGKKQILCRATAIAFHMSLWIECGQLFFHRGTFQFADIAYNTVSGFLGGVIYILILR